MVDNASTLRRRYPRIPWDEPLPVTLTTGQSGYACRYCVALRGLRGEEVPNLPKTKLEVIAHIEMNHRK